MIGPRLLVLDIETFPNLGYHWGLWQQNIGAMDQLVTPGRMLCFGAKWHGERRKVFRSEYHHSRTEMLETIRDLMDEADAIVGWNSQRFDRPWVNAELDKEGFHTPAPSRDIDLMKVAKKNLRLPSYKLDYVAQRHYGLPGKVVHQGFTLWTGVVSEDPVVKARSWRKMRQYQLGDIDVTDAVLERMKPWVTGLPNPALFAEDGTLTGCGCGSTDLQKRGYARTSARVYQRYQCQGCGTWLRDRLSVRGLNADLQRVAR
jgi:DNA polymerase elongation subunit (family B)